MMGRARLLRRLSLCAALGVLTNIAIAWAIAWWVPIVHTSAHFGELRLSQSVYLLLIQSRMGKARIAWEYSRGTTSLFRATTNPSKIPWWAKFDPRESPPPDVTSRTELAAGWPIITFRCELESRTKVHGGLWPGTLTTTDSRGAPRSENRALPIIPVWPGFLINSTLYAALWLPLLLIPTTLSQHARRRRNACLSCGYNLQGLAPAAPCPECGASRSEKAVSEPYPT